MKPIYTDILSRIAEEPQWFDRHGVPRYEPFAPQFISNIYARQAILLLIACQSCGREFLVEMSTTDDGLLGVIEDYIFGQDANLDLVSDERDASPVHYGDPPNVGCCPAGPTMNCIDIEIAEAWELNFFGERRWVRRHDLEVSVIEPHEREFLQNKV